MLVAVVILIVLTLSFSVIAFVSRNENFGILAVALCALTFIAIVASFHLQISSKELTGYIYSSSNQFGYTTAHIRFSQNAGTDAQPEFCVKTNSTPGQAIQKYVGSGTKVKVQIPSFFYLTNNPFACGTTNMTIKEVK